VLAGSAHDPAVGGPQQVDRQGIELLEKDRPAGAAFRRREVVGESGVWLNVVKGWKFLLMM
jgi:hypothetical protein